jgi:hypothetical protein
MGPDPGEIELMTGGFCAHPESMRTPAATTARRLFTAILSSTLAG